MNYTDTSIALLEAISRSRELTDAETDEMARLVKQQKQNTARRWYYATLPAYRDKRKKQRRTPEQLKRDAERRRERAANDPAYRALRNAQSHTGRK